MLTALVAATACDLSQGGPPFKLSPPPPQLIPEWTAPACNLSLPLGGFPRLAGTSNSQIFNGSLSIGAYNHAPMIGFDGVRLFVSWKNDHEDEDSPGERVLFSQSADGIEWVPSVSDAPSELFPNMSTTAMPAALFAGPPLYVAGRMYAAASPKQYCLYPAPSFSADRLLLRRVYSDVPGSLGPIFWSTSTVPPGFELASELNNVSTVDAMDAQTRADVALISNASGYGAGFMPCAAPALSEKCEACAGGCQPWNEAPSNIVFERTHFTVGPADARIGYPQVLLWRSGNGSNPNTLWASVQQGPDDAWSSLVPTNLPNQPANINAGVLPSGRRYLALNPCAARDPLVLATSPDGAGTRRWRLRRAQTLPRLGQPVDDATPAAARAPAWHTRRCSCSPTSLSRLPSVACGRCGRTTRRTFTSRGPTFLEEFSRRWMDTPLCEPLLAPPIALTTYTQPCGPNADR